MHQQLDFGFLAARLHARVAVCVFGFSGVVLVAVAAADVAVGVAAGGDVVYSVVVFVLALVLALAVFVPAIVFLVALDHLRPNAARISLALAPFVPPALFSRFQLFDAVKTPSSLEGSWSLR